MSGNAFKKLGIGPLDDPGFVPTKGVIIRVTPEIYHHIRSEIEPMLQELGDVGHWKTGSSGSWHPEHRYASKGTHRADSGDIDIWLDADKIKQANNLPHEVALPDVKQVVSDKFNATYIVAKAAEVHMAFPAEKEVNGLPAYYQVDFFVRHKAHTVAAHHEHDYSIKDTPYKGVDQQMAIASLVNTIPGYPERSFQYNGMGGELKDRATGKLVTQDLEDLVPLLKVPGLTVDDTGNVEGILAKLPGGIDNPRMAQFKADMAKKNATKLKEGSPDWFKIISRKLAI